MDLTLSLHFSLLGGSESRRECDVLHGICGGGGGSDRTVPALLLVILLRELEVFGRETNVLIARLVYVIL
jgi:hypothetical protein